MKSIIIVITYFGKWPEWFPIFLESCRQNPTIDWLFHTDCNFDCSHVPNVKIKLGSKAHFVQQVYEQLDLRLTLDDPYKLCDVKPLTGVLYEADISGYDFWGYGDVDLIYGDIRKFYTDEVLENNIISTHNWCISGHLALIKNEGWLNNAFRRIKNWKALLEDPSSMRFDEDVFSKVFLYPAWVPASLFFLYDFINPGSKKYRRNLYFREQYTTPLTPNKWSNGSHDHPQVWYWKDGRVFNELNKESEHIYFHFMNYKAPRYVNPIYMDTEFWKERKTIMHLEPDQISSGVKIDRSGFHAFNETETLQNGIKSIP
jgi:hypothetical protein